MKIGLISLGCPKNSVDSEIMLGLLNKEGHEIVNDTVAADIIVINTCAFINDAKEESIMTILEFASLKNEGYIKGIIVVGCLAERYREEIISQIPEVDAVMGTFDYDSIIEAVRSIDIDLDDELQQSKLDITERSHFIKFSCRDNCDWLENERLMTNNYGTAYVKISEGCDNHCTYCIIPKLRGHQISRKIENIKVEVQKLVEAGVKEVILVGQDTTAYGKDIYGNNSLVNLIKEISTIEELKWIRLLYCYPENVDDDLINEFAKNEKLCKYIDIPIQHASDYILKRMARRTNKESVITLLRKMRERIPGLHIRTTFIVGFPGETEEHYLELKHFIEDQNFDQMGVFMYSREEDTPAYNFEDQVQQEVSEARYNELMLLQKKIVDDNNKRLIGTEHSVIVENIAEDGIFYYGRTTFQAPDIDNRVFFASKWELEAGQIVRVRILDSYDYDLTGEVLKC